MYMGLGQAYQNSSNNIKLWKENEYKCTNPRIMWIKIRVGYKKMKIFCNIK